MNYSLKFENNLLNCDRATQNCNYFVYLVYPLPTLLNELLQYALKKIIFNNCSI